MDERFSDPILELASRTDLGDVLELAPTDEEARALLEVIREVGAEEEAGRIAGRLREQGHVL